MGNDAVGFARKGACGLEGNVLRRQFDHNFDYVTCCGKAVLILNILNDIFCLYPSLILNHKIMGNKQVKKIKKTKFKKQYLRFFKLMKKFEQLLKIRFTENNDFVMRKKRT